MNLIPYLLNFLGIALSFSLLLVTSVYAVSCVAAYFWSEWEFHAPPFLDCYYFGFRLLAFFTLLPVCDEDTNGNRELWEKHRLIKAVLGAMALDTALFFWFKSCVLFFPSQDRFAAANASIALVLGFLVWSGFKLEIISKIRLKMIPFPNENYAKLRSPNAEMTIPCFGRTPMGIDYGSS